MSPRGSVLPLGHLYTRRSVDPRARLNRGKRDNENRTEEDRSEREKGGPATSRSFFKPRLPALPARGNWGLSPHRRIA